MENQNDSNSKNASDMALVLSIDDSKLNCLTVVSQLTDQFVGVSLFRKSLRDHMQSHRFEVRALISIINSVITQRRLVFAISRATLGALFKSDPNWPDRTTDQLNSLEYKRILNALFSSGKFVCVQESVGNRSKKGGKPFVIEVVCPQLVEQIMDGCNES